MNLTLFFTEGVSLQTWDTVGMFDRELALYRALLQREVGVTFVTYGSNDELAYEEQLSGIRIRANVKNLRLDVYQRELVMQPPAGEIFKSNQIAGADIAMRAAQKAGARFVARCGYLLSEFQENKYGRRSREAKAAHKLERMVFEAADAAIVTTAEMKDAVVSGYGVAAERVRVIPNYVETERFTPKKQVEHERLRVAFVGRLDRQKNLRTLVKAVRDLDLDVWLVGYGPQREELEVLSRGGRATFFFLGNVPNRELPERLNECDIFVLPSLYEGHPKALLEAMGCGLPAIGTNVPGIRNLLENGVNGLLCEPTVEGVREAVRRLAADGGLRRQLGTAGHSYILENFALNRVAELELDLLRELAA